MHCCESQSPLTAPHAIAGSTKIHPVAPADRRRTPRRVRGTRALENEITTVGVPTMVPYHGTRSTPRASDTIEVAPSDA